MVTTTVEPLSLTAAIDSLLKHGVRVWRDGDMLQVKTPTGAPLKDNIREALRLHKQQLLDAACAKCRSIFISAYDPDGRPLCVDHAVHGECDLCHAHPAHVGTRLCVGCATRAVMDFVNRKTSHEFEGG